MLELVTIKKRLNNDIPYYIIRKRGVFEINRNLRADINQVFNSFSITANFKEVKMDLFMFLK
jgi:hypothetical protein